jgi:hypothetical protein
MVGKAQIAQNGGKWKRGKTDSTKHELRAASEQRNQDGEVEGAIPRGADGRCTGETPQEAEKRKRMYQLCKTQNFT